MTQTEKQIAILLEKFDRKHLAHLAARKKNIDAIFDELAREAARVGKASGFDSDTEEFHFKDFPATQKRIDNIIGNLASNLTISIQEGTKEEWLLAEEKNKRMVNLIAKKTGIERKTIDGWTKPHTEALQAFQERKNEQGKQLSDRVWDMSQQAKEQIELALDIGLGEGKSAADLSRDVRQYLREPHKLFRRVRDKHGVLRLSKAARAYSPGMGVYRSSYKNALRMTATENNMAYRTADHEAWSQLDFVIGQKVQLSNNHTLNGKPFKDMCDELCGDYPKGFKYTGWHPFCRCFVTPILADWNEQLKVMKMRREGKDVSDYHFKGEVTDVPQGYKNWVSNNADRIAKAKSVPYFVRDNYVGGDINSGFKWNESTSSTKTIIDNAINSGEEKVRLKDIYGVSFKEDEIDAFNALLNVPSDSDYELKEIPLDKVVSIQDKIYTEGVQKYLNNELDNDTIQVIKIGDRYFIQDGNHRAVAAMYRGEKHIKADVKEASNETYKELIRLANGNEEEQAKFIQIYLGNDTLPSLSTRKKTQTQTKQQKTPNSGMFNGIKRTKKGYIDFFTKYIGRTLDSREIDYIGKYYRDEEAMIALASQFERELQLKNSAKK